MEVTDTAKQAVEAQAAPDPNAVEGPPMPKAAPKKKAPAPKPVAPAGGSHEKKSKLDDINKKLKAGYSVADVQKFQKNHKGGAAKKAAAKKPAAKAAPIKKKPVKKPAAPSAAIPDRTDVSEELAEEKAAREATQAPPSQDDAQVDAQADDIISQIKNAAISVKGLGENGGIDETQLKSAFAGMNLLQLDSDMHAGEASKAHAADIDNNAATALEFMSQQFPEDYPEDHKPAPPPPGPTEAEKAEAEKKALIQYATDVAAEAKAYTDGIKEAEEQKKEDAALARMGMPGEPVAVQLDDNVKLAQTKSDLDITEGEELQEAAATDAAAAEGEGKGSPVDLFASKSPAEQAAALQNMNQEELDALTQNLNQIDSSSPKAAAPAKPKAPVPTKEDYAAAAAQMGVSTTPAGEVQQQVPENLAQAADVVTNESELEALRASSNLDAQSFDDLKRQAIAAAKAEKAQEVAKPKKPAKKATPIVKQIKPPTDDLAATAAQDPEFAAKAAVVAKAEAANAIAVDNYKPASQDKGAVATSAASEAEQVAAYEAEQKAKEQEKKIQAKYAADKQ